LVIQGFWASFRSRLDCLIRGACLSSRFFKVLTAYQIFDERIKNFCLLLHNNFLVFNISDNCWKSSHNVWTLPNHNSRVTLGFRFPSMLQRVPSIFYRPVLKTNVLGELQESVPFEMTDKSLHVKLVIVSLLEHNLNQRISHFRSFNPTRKVNIDQSFGSSTFKPDIAQPTVR